MPLRYNLQGPVDLVLVGLAPHLRPTTTALLPAYSTGLSPALQLMFA